MWVSRLCRMRKLNYRVVFPFELKLRNTSDDCKGGDDFYDLFAVVVHVGQGPNHGTFLCPACCHLPLYVGLCLRSQIMVDSSWSPCLVFGRVSLHGEVEKLCANSVLCESCCMIPCCAWLLISHVYAGTYKPCI